MFAHTARHYILFTEPDANGIEVFATQGVVDVVSLDAWKLDPKGQTGIDRVEADDSATADGPVTVYDTLGRPVLTAADVAEARTLLPPSSAVARIMYFFSSRGT